MNIKEATKQIEGAVRAYLSRDSRGLYRIPMRHQRPIVMFGPPGVGKTAIVAQIADRMDINFVSYSITHHTRQSALGLPMIVHEQLGGKDIAVSEYTMSEIIASVHRAIEKSGVAQGILFLDEVNCVSETLAPAMLQFLQYKTFGMHALPEGWVIVAAGNPPEYNRAAREFDPAMMDRLKRIDVDPDLGVWQEYAAQAGVHPAVTTYLEARPGAFYRVQAGTTGTSLVTARGWEDLSRMLQAYEVEDIPVDAALVGQYLQDTQAAREFFAYYSLFRKYQDDYRVTTILDGEDASVPAARAKAAKFDERIALVGLLDDALTARIHEAIELEEGLQQTRKDLARLKPAMAKEDFRVAANLVSDYAKQVADASMVGTRDPFCVADPEVVRAERLRLLDAAVAGIGLGQANGMADPFEAARSSFNLEVARHDMLVDKAVASLDNAFAFMDDAFGPESQESLILVARISADQQAVKLVSEYGSDGYMAHNSSLLFTQRALDLKAQIMNEDDEA